MVKAKKFILAHHFDGAPKADNFQLVEEELPELKPGGNAQLIGFNSLSIFEHSIFCRDPGASSLFEC